MASAPRIAVVVLLVLAAPAASEEPPVADTSLVAEWSFTLIGQVKVIPSPEDDDGVGGWFDQTEYTPNKDSGFPFEIGIREGSFDLLRDESALFQARFRSPSSNLGISGSDIDEPFFNQRLDAFTRLPGFEIDLSYWRMRTEQLRVFPNTRGPGLLFDDFSDTDQRFFRDRTGFRAEGRLRPYEAFPEALRPDAGGDGAAWLRPELSLRGGYEARDGRTQLRFHRPPSNEWLGLSQDRDRSVSRVGGGVLVAPDGLFTLTFDFDHERLRSDTGTLTEGDLGYAPPESTRTIGFVPETDRSTGSVRFNSRLGERATVEGGFQVSQLEQVGDFTPEQRAAGLKHNEVRSYAANAAFEVALVRDLSMNGFFKFDRRENDIERNTPLFNPVSQIDPFVEDWERIAAGAELVLGFGAGDRAAIGLEYEDVARDLDFAVPPGLRILPGSTHIDRDTRRVSLYGRGALRPLRGLRIDAELGYRWAPDTGYASELDENLYGELRASYVFALGRPVVLSALLKGGTGENDDFTLTSGQGPVPAGASLRRTYERSGFVAGMTASVSPTPRLSLSASFYYARDDHDATLDLSNLQRYFQDVVPIDFSRDGTSRFENKQASLVLGLHHQLDERTDAGLSYSFTRVDADYRGSDDTAVLGLAVDEQEIDSDTHVLDLEVGHQLVEGLRVLAGYRFQRYKDRGSRPESVSSARRPFDPTTHQHSVTLGVTLTNAFFER